MGVERTPAIDDNPSDVGVVIAVGIFKEEKDGSLRHNNPSVGESEARRNVQFVGKDGELVLLAVAIGIFAYFDPVSPDTLFISYGIGIINRFDYPQPSLFIPFHGIWIDNVRFYD